MIILPIKKKWFDMIKSGEKKEEYREIKPYYTSRFKHIFPHIVKIYTDGDFMFVKQESPKIIIFRNGYRYDSPKIRCRCNLRIGTGKPEWGAEPNKEYYILDILEVYE